MEQPKQFSVESYACNITNDSANVRAQLRTHALEDFFACAMLSLLASHMRALNPERLTSVFIHRLRVKTDNKYAVDKNQL